MKTHIMFDIRAFNKYNRKIIKVEYKNSTIQSSIYIPIFTDVDIIEGENFVLYTEPEDIIYELFRYEKFKQNYYAYSFERLDYEGGSIILKFQFKDVILTLIGFSK